MKSSDNTQANFTLIVNWKEKGFGCSKVCSYCNWRSSPLLPHGAQTPAEISAFISQCRKSFVTISGGGDPLYRFEENRAALLLMAETVKAQGLKVRIITREVQHVTKLKYIADHVSISLDDDVLSVLDEYLQPYEGQDLGFDIEFSVVLPPLPEEKLIELRPQYAALHRRLGRRLVLRENFNSVFPLAPLAMSFGHQGIVFVPKSLCLSGRYLSTIDCTGNEIVQDNAELAKFLMDRDDAVLFGGFVKHLIDPVVHLEYNDIDLIALSTSVMDELTDKYGFSFKETSDSTCYPRYFLGKSDRAGKSVQVVLLQSIAGAKKFIFNSQYTVDRVGYCRGFFFDPATGEAEIRKAIQTKTAQLAQGTRSMELFHVDRDEIERRHVVKLIKKGFRIVQ